MATDLPLDYYNDFVSASAPPPSDALSSPVPEGDDDDDDTSTARSESSDSDTDSQLRIVPRIGTSDSPRARTDEPQDEIMWTFDEIKEHKKKKGKTLLKVQWSNGDITWEPLGNMIEDDPISVLRHGKQNKLLDDPEWENLKHLRHREGESAEPDNEWDSEPANPTIKQEEPEAQPLSRVKAHEGAEADDDTGNKSTTKFGRKVQPRDMCVGTFLGRAMAQTQNRPQCQVDQCEAGGHLRESE